MLIVGMPRRFADLDEDAWVIDIVHASAEVQGFERKSFIVTEDADMMLGLEGYEEDGASPVWFTDRPVVEIWVPPIVPSMDVATEVLSLIMAQQRNWSLFRVRI